ncbi:MAG: LytR/AlgR family response regulator transcription factor [Vagococcus sp.]
MTHVLIVDDEPLAREELTYLVSQHPAISSTADADSVDEAMEKIMDHKPDIIFLDIHLTNESGFDLAEKLTKLSKPPYLIFATAYDDYALKAFKVNAMDYILKPFDALLINQALDKAIHFNNTSLDTNNVSKEKDSLDTIPIQGEDRIFLVHPADIYLVSVDDKELSVQTKTETYKTTGTLSGIEKKLPTDTFFKTHRSFILNSSKIQEIQPWFNHTLQVTLDNGIKVPVSRSYVKPFKEKIGLI